MVSKLRNSHGTVASAAFRTVTATEAKNRLGAIMKEAQEGPVIVENRGIEQVAIISIDDLVRFAALQEAEERRRDLAELEQIRRRVSARNTDLAEEEKDAFVKQLVDEAFQSMIDKDMVRLED